MNKVSFKKRLIIYVLLFTIALVFIGGTLSVTNVQMSYIKDQNVLKRMQTYQTKLMENLNPIVSMPKVIKNELVKENFLGAMKALGILFLGLIGLYEYKNRNKGGYENIEHGSSAWAKGEEYQILNKNTGVILAQEKYLTVDNRFINKNVLIFGGAGSRKSRGYVMPNILQMLGSYVITDPKGELYDTTAGFLRQNGYEVRVINLVNPDCSDSYNPLAHIGSTIDVDIISSAIIQNTSGEGKSSSDPFWEQAEKALLNACIYYILSMLPEPEQNLASVLSLVRAGADFDYMDNLFMKLPYEHMGRKNYETFRLAVDKTRASVLIGLATRLNPFDTPQISALTGSNSIDIDAMGSKKVAVYVITPDSHSTFNFIPTMFFGQVLQRLYDVADKNHGTLDVPVFFLLDEFANTGRIPDFNQKISTSRSRKLNISVILQSLDQLIDLYKDTYENIIANCDTHIFLGSQAIKTCEYVSKSLGETTIKKNQTSVSTSGENSIFGATANYSRSRSESDNSMGRSLMTVDELKRLDLNTCIVMVKGTSPIKAKKYDISMHPRYTESAKLKVSHNDETLVNRGEWKTFNPYTYNPDANTQAEQQQEEPEVEIEFDIQKQLEEKFDELFGLTSNDQSA